MKTFKLERKYKRKKFLSMEFDSPFELCMGLKRILEHKDVKGVEYKITVQKSIKNE